MWAEIKHALNRTLGTNNFRPLDEIIKASAINEAYKTMVAEKAIKDGGTVTIVPDGTVEVTATMFSGITPKSVFMPDTVKTIGVNALADKVSLETVIIGNGVKTISSGALATCSNLKNIVMGQNVETIGDGAFTEVGATTLHLPATVKTIGSGIMSDSQIIVIAYDGTVAQWNAITKAPNWDELTSTYTIYCADGTI